MSYHTLWWGRGQPLTKGHELGIRKAYMIATKNGGYHTILFSYTHDTKNNPLTPEQKLAYAKMVFPGMNIKIAVRGKPSIFHYASDVYETYGASRLVVVAGSDRIEQYEKLLNFYNGKALQHGYYNFENIEVVSAGVRNGSCISGTKMRSAAISDDRDTFHDGAPDAMAAAQKDAMFDDVRKGLNLKRV